MLFERITPGPRAAAAAVLLCLFAVLPAGCVGSPRPSVTDGAPSTRAWGGLLPVVWSRPVAPDFSLRNHEDRMVSLSDYRGRYVHLDFSADWCAPCHFQARYLRALEEELEPYGFVSMTVMVTRNPADVKRWASRYRLRNVVGDLEGVARGRFEAFSYPTNIIIRPDGSVASRWAGAPRNAESFQRQLRRVVPEMFQGGPTDNNSRVPGAI